MYKINSSLNRMMRLQKSARFIGAALLLASAAQSASASCTYAISSEWPNGFTASITIKNDAGAPINNWNVNWQYGDGSKITNLWNASLSGSNPYAAKNLSWNSTIQPGQTVEFGFQGSKGAGAASVPAITGSVCQ